MPRHTASLPKLAFTQIGGGVHHATGQRYAYVITAQYDNSGATRGHVAEVRRRRSRERIAYCVSVTRSGAIAWLQGEYDSREGAAR